LTSASSNSDLFSSCFTEIGQNIMGNTSELLPPAPAAATIRSGQLAPGIALVTGGARGLGNAIAVSFAREGARGVALVDISDDATFAKGKAAVEAFGTKVSIFKRSSLF
jgi:hypothetical protein